MRRFGGNWSRTEPIEVSVRLCCDHEIRLLNAEWRGKDQSTDVLSFIITTCLCLIGRLRIDVVISIDTASVQATKHGHSLSDELVVLLTHGVLHLLGFDDEPEDARQQMAAAEDEILKRRGLRSGLVGRTV